jgi:hypothetical protein
VVGTRLIRGVYGLRHPPPSAACGLDADAHARVCVCLHFMLRSGVQAQERPLSAGHGGSIVADAQLGAAHPASWGLSEQPSLSYAQLVSRSCACIG